MLLNVWRQETLYNTGTSHADVVLEKTLVHAFKIKLKAVIGHVLSSLPQTPQMLQQHLDLIRGLIEEVVNVPRSVLGHWAKLVADTNQPPPAQLLKQLETINNYNPVLMATMRLFKNSLKVVQQPSGIV